MEKKVFMLLLLVQVWAFSQQPVQKMTREEYIAAYSSWAVREMHESGVPASITLAQGMLESDNGNSSLAVEANNHFGIKCHSSWEGKTFYQDDDAKHECFRKYKTVYESFKDHSDFLRKYDRYAFLFKLEITDYKGWCEGLKSAGYATNPKYPQLLIKIIEDNQLYQYDTMKADGNEPLADNDNKQNKPKNNHKGNSKIQGDDNFTISTSGREIKQNNRINYIVAKDGDNIKSLAKELQMMDWQLIKYNDLDKNTVLKKGQRVYIQPKRNKADFKYDFHIVKAGETMYDISQQYGVKLNKLYRKNIMEPGTKLKTGDKIFLRKTKKTV